MEKSMQWKKSRWNELPSLWDGQSSWCLQLGPDQAGVSVARLSTNPPDERPVHSLIFQLPTHSAAWVLEELYATATHCLSAQKGVLLLVDAGVANNPYFQW